jgi:uncharacterized protein
MAKRVVHVEFPAQDVDRAERFWEGVGGWSIEDAGMPGIEYRMFQEGDQGGAVYPTMGEPGPIVYYGSDDKQPIPGVGWFARCKDTEGNPFSLFQSDESVPPPAA